MFIILLSISSTTELEVSTVALAGIIDDKLLQLGPYTTPQDLVALSGWLRKVQLTVILSIDLLIVTPTKLL